MSPVSRANELASLRVHANRLMDSAFSSAYVKLGANTLSLFKEFISKFYDAVGDDDSLLVISDDQLVEFFIWLRISKQLSPSSLTTALPALTTLCKKKKIPLPSLFRVRLIIRALVREKNLHAVLSDRLPATGIRKRIPLSFWCLIAIERVIVFSSLLRFNTFVFMCVATFGMFRASELVFNSGNVDALILTNNDVSVTDRAATFTLRSSKGRRDRRCVHVSVPANNLSVCPVRLLKTLLSCQTNKDPSAPLFQKADGSPLLYTDVLMEMRDIVYQFLPCFRGYVVGTHSARIGGATSYVLLKHSPQSVQTFGRWAAVSTQCFRRYVRLPPTASIPADVSRLDPSSISRLFGGLPVKNIESMSWESLSLAASSLSPDIHVGVIGVGSR